jgi:hypothetical protein
VRTNVLDAQVLATIFSHSSHPSIIFLSFLLPAF